MSTFGLLALVGGVALTAGLMVGAFARELLFDRPEIAHLEVESTHDRAWCGADRYGHEVWPDLTDTTCPECLRSLARHLLTQPCADTHTLYRLAFDLGVDRTGLMP